jgi:hypothetical protein
MAAKPKKVGTCSCFGGRGRQSGLSHGERRDGTLFGSPSASLAAWKAPDQRRLVPLSRNLRRELLRCADLPAVPWLRGAASAARVCRLFA